MMQGMNDWAVSETARGFFWRADEQEDNACPGTLTLTSDGGATLELFGWERETDPTAQARPGLIPGRSHLFSFNLVSHHRVLGAVEGLGLVTLDRCVATGLGRAGQVPLSRASYKVEVLTQGLHYEIDGEMSLRKLGFYAAGLEQMLRGLDVQETTLDDGCLIRFVPDSDYTTTHAEIRPQTASNLLYLSKHALAIRDFLTLARMRESAIYAIWATEENAPAEHAVVKIRAPLPWNDPGAERGFISPERMLFAIQDMKENFTDIVGRWARLYAKYEDAVNLYFTNEFMTYAPTHVKLSVLFRAIDAWYRVDHAVPDKERTPPFGETLDDLINRYTDDLEVSFSMLADRERVREMRNAITHPGRTASLWAGDALEYVATERQLALLMQICMLRKIGFGDAVVQDIVSRDAVQHLLHTKFIEFV